MEIISTEHIKVNILNLNIDSKYFSFDYQIYRNNGNVSIESSYENSHSWGENHDKLKQYLIKSYAVDLALEHAIENEI